MRCHRLSSVRALFEFGGTVGWANSPQVGKYRSLLGQALENSSSFLTEFN
jgi:hypothetical protein